MDDPTNPYEAPDASLVDSVESTRWSPLRWLPAVLCVFLGLNLIFLGALTALEVAWLFREQGWGAFERSASHPATSLAAASLGVILFVASGVSAILASSSWMGRRWLRATLLTASIFVLMLAGAFLLGYSRLVLNSSR